MKSCRGLGLKSVCLTCTHTNRTNEACWSIFYDKYKLSKVSIYYELARKGMPDYQKPIENWMKEFIELKQPDLLDAFNSIMLLK